jgi:hypothetical protein
MRSLVRIGLAVAALTVPAGAALADAKAFASFVPTGPKRSLAWLNEDKLPTLADESQGAAGELFTFTPGGALTPGSMPILFTLNTNRPIAKYLFAVPAELTLYASTTGDNPATGAPDFRQAIATGDGSIGTFTITNREILTLPGRSWAPGTANILSGSFSDGTLSGSRAATTGAIDIATASGATLSFTSDFLDFDDGADNAIALSLTGAINGFFQSPATSTTLRERVVTPTLVPVVTRVPVTTQVPIYGVGKNKNVIVGYRTVTTYTTVTTYVTRFVTTWVTKNFVTEHSLQTFKANVAGSFATSVAARPLYVPEPASWALLVTGFGLAGAAMRRRRTVAA